MNTDEAACAAPLIGNNLVRKTSISQVDSYILHPFGTMLDAGKYCFRNSFINQPKNLGVLRDRDKMCNMLGIWF